MRKRVVAIFLMFSVMMFSAGILIERHAPKHKHSHPSTHDKDQIKKELADTQTLPDNAKQ